MNDLTKDDGGLMAFGDDGQRMATSLDLANPANRVILLKAMQDCDARLTESVNLRIDVCDYLAHDVELTSTETGELVKAVRLVLIDDQNRSYECVSNTLLRSLKTVFYAFSPPPWSPPLGLTVRTKKRGERSIYFFEVDANIIR